MKNLKEWLKKHKAADLLTYPVDGGDPIAATYFFHKVDPKREAELSLLLAEVNEKKETK